MAKTIEQRLQEAQAAEAKAKQRVRALQSVAAGVERKRDTKRKILLGAWLIENKPEAIERIVAGLTRESDRAAFEGWTPPPKKAQEAPKPAQVNPPPTQAPKEPPAASVARPAMPPGGGVLRRPMGG